MNPLRVLLTDHFAIRVLTLSIDKRYRGSRPEFTYIVSTIPGQIPRLNKLWDPSW